MVVDKNGPRKLKPEEQLRLMGFPSTHLELKAKLQADAKGQLIGNSFSVIAVARLLASLVTTPEEASSHDITLLLWKVWERNEQRAACEGWSQALEDALWIRGRRGVGGGESPSGDLLACRAALAAVDWSREETDRRRTVGVSPDSEWYAQRYRYSHRPGATVQCGRNHPSKHRPVKLDVEGAYELCLERKEPPH